ADHFLLSAMAGPGFLNPYRSTTSIDGRLAYYFSEGLGLEAVYERTFNVPNNTYKALLSTNTSGFPLLREIQSEEGLLLHWVPWYSKINVFNDILYFDWYFEGGVGAVNTQVNTVGPNGGAANINSYVSDNHTGFFLGTGHQYHISEVFTVR